MRCEGPCLSEEDGHRSPTHTGVSRVSRVGCTGAEDAKTLTAGTGLSLLMASETGSSWKSRRLAIHRTPPPFGGKSLKVNKCHWRVQTLRTLAGQFVARRITAEGLATMSDSEVEARLIAVPGGGPWTVHGFLIIALDRSDVVLPGDVALRRAVQRAYQLTERPSPEEVLAIAEPWRPYRTLASAYLFASSSAKGSQDTMAP
jgi:hypothetical protein